MEQDRHVVASAAREDKQVPDTVAVAKLVVGSIEHDAPCIQQAAGRQPGKAGAAKYLDQGTDGEHGKPALYQIDDERRGTRPAREAEFLGDPEEGQAHTTPNSVHPRVPRSVTSVNGV